MHELYAKKEKCALAQEQVSFFGHIVGHGQIRPDPKKLQDIQDWEPLHNVHEVRQFFSLANYYKKFFGGYSRIASPLTDFLKDISWKWGEKQQSAFDSLKEKLFEEPVLPLTEVGVWNESDFSSNTLVVGLWKAQSPTRNGVPTTRWIGDPQEGDSPSTTYTATIQFR
ncbi:uncharacterized mitochondrial protein AtMg00860-like [Cryptomeria japonica]|uniref:uncharacterized mitochondrial protein AtMg00860-like n=1 Tax=Cryptomeria japonica TaxID=3369 RepID=UPI0027D9EA86|nr:uncharacterized mitochondrial protein AtMg00860-like [Cryptomeria japonica]